MPDFPYRLRSVYAWRTKDMHFTRLAKSCSPFPRRWESSKMPSNPAPHHARDNWRLDRKSGTMWASSATPPPFWPLQI